LQEKCVHAWRMTGARETTWLRPPTSGRRQVMSERGGRPGSRERLRRCCHLTGRAATRRGVDGVAVAILRTAEQPPSQIPDGLLSLFVTPATLGNTPPGHLWFSAMPHITGKVHDV
jgi:hypothetical protein